MKIESIEAAFLEIEKKQERIPVEAIEYLQQCETNELIIEKIKYSLENAYNEDVYYDATINYYYPTPLWYAIAAEAHLCEALIQPVIHLYTVTSKEGWDYLNEQGMNLIGLLCEKFGDRAVTPTLEFILSYSGKKEVHPILYLFDCLYFINKEKHLPIIFEILKYDQFVWLEAFAVGLANAQITETTNRLKEIQLIKEQQLPKELDSFLKGDLFELQEAIEELETQRLKYPTYAQPSYKRRADWRQRYQVLFKKKEPITDYKPNKKIGRNDPCICGSGKKYKKCCLHKLKAQN